MMVAIAHSRVGLNYDERVCRVTVRQLLAPKPDCLFSTSRWIRVLSPVQPVRHRRKAHIPGTIDVTQREILVWRQRHIHCVPLIKDEREDPLKMENETRLLPRSKASLRIDDLICPRCSVQATAEAETVCELCAALGKSIDPLSKGGVWSDIRFGCICAKRFIFGLNA